MKLLRLVIFLVLLVGVLASVSNINLNPTGLYPELSTNGGLYVSISILIYMLFAELGYLPYRFRGKKRSTMDNLLNPAMFMGNRDLILKVIRSIDQRDCLLRYLCELEALRIEAKKKNLPLDPKLEERLILLKVAKRNMHPAELMREDPGSPALPFELAIFTGSEGAESCGNVFKMCPHNITTMQTFLEESFSHRL